MPKQVVLVPGIGIPPSPFNHVVRAGDFLFVSSQLSVNLTTHTLLSGDIARQTRQALENLKLNTSKRVPRRLASQSKRSLLCQESMWRLTLLLISRPDGRRAHEEPQLARPDVHDPGDDLRHQGPGLSFTGAGRVRSFRRCPSRARSAAARLPGAGGAGPVGERLCENLGRVSRLQARPGLYRHRAARQSTDCREPRAHRLGHRLAASGHDAAPREADRRHVADADRRRPSVNQLPVWAPDPGIRKKVLVDNPARLYAL